jgi:hypothetical protein
MATKKGGAKKGSTKGSKKPKKTAKGVKKPAKKAGGSKKPAAAKKAFSIAGAVEGCAACVVNVLRTASGREPKAQMKLSELFANCNPGVIQMLKGQFNHCPDSDPNANFTCNSTVADVVERVCGF